MTIFNISVWPDRAVVSADSEGRFPGGGFRHAYKIFPLVPNAVIAGCGPGPFIIGVYDNCASSGMDVDQLHDTMQGRLALNYRMLMDMVRDDPKQKIVLVLVGWSPRNRRMMGWDWQVGSSGCIESEIKTWLSNFWPPELGAWPNPKTPAEFADVMERQVRIRQRLPGAAGGGRCIVAQLSKNATNIAAVRELPAR